MNKGKVIFLIPILLLGTIFAPAIIHPIHAAVTGEICLNDPTTANGSITPCPATPAIFDGPKAQQIRVGVYVQGSDALSGFDIILLANHTIVTPVGVDLTGTILPGTPTVILECLQGLLKAGSVCGSQDNIDALHFTVTAGLGLITVPPTTGLLFTAVYNITGTAVATGTPIGFQAGCTSTSVTGGVCVTIANGSTTPDSETAQAGRFNNSNPPPFVTVTASPSSFGPELPSTTNTATITATASPSYPGFATDAVTFTTVASPGLTATLTGTNPCATGGTSCIVSLSLTAATPGNYFVIVSGTYATIDSLNNPDTLVSTVTLHVVVNDFSIAVNPTSVSFASGSTATATVTLTSQNGFAGSITLSNGAIIPTTPTLSITYNPSTVTLTSGATMTSTATFSASPTIATTYHAQVKATSGTRVKMSPTLTIQVGTAATPDFALSASPTSLSIIPGATGTSTLTVAPLNGFTATVNLATTVSPATGPTASLSAASIAGGFGSSTLTISSQSSTPTGTYNITITGTSGTLTHVIAVTVVVSSSGVGVVCIVSSGTTSCPSIPTTLTGTQGTQLRVSIFIQGSSALNGFDITLQADHNVLRPVGVDLNGTVLPTPTTIVSECIGGIIVHGNSCPGNADTLELAAVGAVAQITFPPTTGLLFTAIYNVTGATSGIPLGYRTGCSGGSVSGTTTCVTISSGSTSPVLESVQTAIFSTSTTPDFVMNENPTGINIVTGSSGTSTLSISSINNFTGTIALSATVSPSGPAVTLSTTSATVPVGGAVTVVITIMTNNATSTGAYLVTLTGTSGALHHSTVLSVEVVPETVSPLAIDGSAQAFCAHDTNSCTATLTTQHTNDVIIVYTVESLDLQPSCSFSVSDISGLSWIARSNVVFGQNNRDQIQEFYAKSTGALSSDVITESILGCASVQYGGEYNGLMVFGISGANFNSPFDPNVSLPGTATGNSYGASVLVSTTSPNDMLIGGIWHGVISPLTAGNGFTLLDSNPGAAMAAESENVNIVVTNFNVAFGDNATADWVLVGDAVQPAGPATPDFSLSASPGSVTLTPGSSATSVITAMSLNGFAGTLSLTSTSSPAGIASTLSTISVTLSSGNTATSVLTVSTMPSTHTGTYTVTLTGSNGPISRTTILMVTVIGPDFTMTGSPLFVSTPSGSSATFLITLTSQNGFSGNVNLTATLLTSGVSPPVALLIPPIVFLSAGGSQTSTLLLTTTPSTTAETFTISVVGTATAGSTFLFHRVLVNLQVVTPPDIPPVASFTFSPSNPIVGEQVEFDGSSSFDPDGTVVSWIWNPGNGLGILTFGSPTLYYTYNVPGNYTVTLTVRDNAGLTGSKSMTVSVRPQPAHDVSIVSVNAQGEVVATQLVGISIQVRNEGSSNETVSLTAYANGRIIGTLRNVFLQGCPINQFQNFCYYYNYEDIVWNTTGYAPGNYTISATISLPAGEVDPTPADNSLTDGIVTVFPAPVLSVTPNSGGVGTKVTVSGSGFLPPIPGYGSQGPLWVTFDDMFLGYDLNAQNGTFTFTFDVPQAQPGTHLVKAINLYSGARASATFTVTATNAGNLAATINTGSVYFPGDNVVAYVLTTLNGVPTGPSNVQLTVTLFFSNGTSRSMTTASLGPGLYEAIYTVPTTGPLGTYAIIAKAHMAGPLDASSMATFEVKLSWLTSNNGKITVGATTLAGAVGLVGLAWKKGYLRRKNDDSTPVGDLF